MVFKIIEALTRIFEGMNNRVSLNDIHTELKKENIFDEQTISAAFSYVYDRVISKGFMEKFLLEKNRNFRILNDEEKDILGIDNYNYLLKLKNIGLLNSSDFGKVIDQLVSIPRIKFTKEDINFIVLLSLVDFQKDLSPGSRMVLFSSDTIN